MCVCMYVYVYMCVSVCIIVASLDSAVVEVSQSLLKDSKMVAKYLKELQVSSIHVCMYVCMYVCVY